MPAEGLRRAPPPGTKPLVLSTAHNMMKNNAEEQRVKDAGGVVFRSRLGQGGPGRPVLLLSAAKPAPDQN